MTEQAGMRGPTTTHQIVIIGGGAAGISVAASLLKRQKNLDIAIIEPSEVHSYQPGWTMVGGGVFSPESTRRPMASVMPSRSSWYRTGARHVDTTNRQVVLEDGRVLGWRRLIVAPGLELNWGAIDGLSETLGCNGVTSNYRYDLASYTWWLVRSMKSGTALFSQPPMPIKCAGAPQKAMYLSCDHWYRQSCLDDINVDFCTAGDKLFGVPDYVPALERYVERYGINLQFQNRLVAVDGPSRTAWFAVNGEQGETTVERSFDMLHVVPPQRAPAFIAESGLANEAGWLDLDDETLQHRSHHAIFGLGDASGTPNAKTAAAVRTQAPVVADNLLASLRGEDMPSAYRGYGSCPLTVERGRIVLAEFGYGGQLQPTFPKWLNNGTKPTRLAWWLKAGQLPWIYWKLSLRGHEWLAAPDRRDTANKG